MSVDTYDSEPYQVEPNARQRRAKIEHHCSCCREVIRRGDLYINEFSVFDGNSHTTKRCLRCQTIYDHLIERHADIEDAGVDTELHCGHDYQEVFQEDPPEHIARLAFMTADEMQAEQAAKILRLKSG